MMMRNVQNAALFIAVSMLVPALFFGQSIPTTISGDVGESSLPAWGRPGRLRVEDWYGGPLLTAQCLLLGTPGFYEANPDVLYATTTRYDDPRRTVDQLVRAHLNWIAVTWSSGFSNESEHTQQNLLRAFIAECHRRGIHVTAYLSIAMMVPEDMFPRMPESRDWPLVKDGQPVPYGSPEIYKKLGRVTSYMADLRKPGWQQETLHRALAAVDAGADSVYFDNNLTPQIRSYGPELMGHFKAGVLAEGRRRNPHLIVTSNYHGSCYFLARYENSANTEDGFEPGIFPSEAEGDTVLQESHPEAAGIPVKAGRLIMNAGLLRMLNAVSEGWRPVWVNDGHQHVGTYFSDAIPAPHQKLAQAECQAFQTAYENFHGGKITADLFLGKKAAVENWNALTLYNSFFEEHEPLYTSPASLARIAVIVNPKSEVKDLAFLNRLAARNIIYDAVYEQDAEPAKLSRYAVVIAAPSVELRPGWRRSEAVATPEIEAALPAKIAAPDSVVMNVHGQANSKRVLVHLLNYGDTQVSGIEVKVRGHFDHGTLLSPDGVKTTIEIQPAGEFTRIVIPELKTYDLLVL